MRTQHSTTSFELPTDQLLIDGEFDEYDSSDALSAAFHTEMEDSWSDEELLELM